MRRNLLLSLSALSVSAALAIGAGATVFATGGSEPTKASSTTPTVSIVDGHDFLVRQRVAVGDVNGDGAINAADLTVWRARHPGVIDVDADGDVDGADFLAWQRSVVGDFDGDGDVDGRDFLAWRAR